MNIIGLILLSGIGEQIVASSHNFITLACKLTRHFYCIQFTFVDSLLFCIVLAIIAINPRINNFFLRDFTTMTHYKNIPRIYFSRIASTFQRLNIT